jgi:hypothetical protein
MKILWLLIKDFPAIDDALLVLVIGRVLGTCMGPHGEEEGR